MSRYNLQELVSLWARDRLTTEQAIGQVLLHIEYLSKRVSEVEKRTNPARLPGRGEAQQK